jgi:hypothetical protein
MARVYADVNDNMPRSYWDYDGVNISTFSGLTGPARQQRRDRATPTQYFSSMLMAENRLGSLGELRGCSQDRSEPNASIDTHPTHRS